MEKLFIAILNMSLSASYVILVVIGIRLLIRKLPKFYGYLLWSIVWLRLINPFKIESALSLVKIHHQTIPEDIGYARVPAIHSGIYAINRTVNDILPSAAESASVNPMQIYLFIGQTVWLLVFILLLCYMLFTVIKMHIKLRASVHLFDNVYETSVFKSPFVFGSRIYLTPYLEASEREYILVHEQTHIKRRDHIIKPIAFFIACVHWFNPLVWIAYKMMEIDMELSCDESVIQHFQGDIKAVYSKSLLSFAGKEHAFYSSPLTFGEKATVKRIKNVLSYKKPPFWVMLIVLVAIGILSAGLLTTPKSVVEESPYLKPQVLASSISEQAVFKIDNVEMGGYTRISGSETAKWINETDWREKNIKSPLELIPSYVLMNLSGADVKSEIRLYESEPALAMILYEDQWRYYEINEAGYNAMLLSIMSRSYFEPYGDENRDQGSKAIEKSPVSVVNVDMDLLFNEMMASPQTSSNPNDYIKAHREIYEEILSYGDLALSYCFIEFESGDQTGLKGHLMASVAKELCDVEEEINFETGQAWYDQFLISAIDMRSSMGNEEFEKWKPKLYLLLSIHEGNLNVSEMIMIPDFEYLGDDIYLKLAYMTEIQYQIERKRKGQFFIPAIKIHEVSKEEDQIRIFATIADAFYSLSGNEVKEEAGSVVPVAFTYQMDSDGNYVLVQYEEAKDGSLFWDSIKAFCVTPLSGKKIEGLPEKIMNSYVKDTDLSTLERENLIEHLLRYDLHGIVLVTGYDDTRVILTD